MYVFKSETVHVKTQLLKIFKQDYKNIKSQISETELVIISVSSYYDNMFYLIQPNILSKI